MTTDKDPISSTPIESINDVSNMPDVGDGDGHDTKNISFMCFRDMNSQGLQFIFLSIFAVFGSTLRMYSGRIFGLDCDIPPTKHDYLTPLSTCVTATGLTGQRGGALFIDLPANMLGSFIMGIMNADRGDIAAVPWLGSNHRLQNYSSIHQSIRVAFCGSLTTFASWNTQMVTMMMGSESIVGPQIVPALFGYLLGIICATSSFRFGRSTALLFHRIRYPQHLTSDHSVKNDMNSDENRSSILKSTDRITKRSKEMCLCMLNLLDLAFHSKYSSIICFVILLTLFFLGYFIQKDSFHKSLLICTLLSPPGTILRWKLSSLNYKRKNFPLGTFVANLFASIVSVICEAISSRLSFESSSLASLWLIGIKTGFAGNLSTVSTLAKELVLLSDNDNELQSVVYAFLTLFICCISSLSLYALIIYA